MILFNKLFSFWCLKRQIYKKNMKKISEISWNQNNNKIILKNREQISAKIKKSTCYDYAKLALSKSLFFNMII